MSGLTMQRAKRKYLAKQLVPFDGRGRRVGTLGVWLAGIGLVLFITSYWNLAVAFGR